MGKLTLVLLFLFQQAYAQTDPESSEVAKLSEEIVDISVSSDPQDPKLQLEVSELEDQVYETGQRPAQCGVTNPPTVGESNLEEQTQLPENYKDKGWKVLFEVKWMPIDHKAGFVPRDSSTRFNNRSRSYGQYFMDHNDTSGDAGVNFADLRAYATQASTQDNTVTFNQTMNSALYNWLGTTTDTQQLDKRIEHISKNLNDEEFLQFLSSVSGELPYNDDRAGFIQQEGAAKGKNTLLGMITETQSGVCGDIHSVVAKLAEKRGWEAFTIGYGSRGGGGQHVVAAVVNPNNPGEIHLVNYDQIETNDLTDGNSIQFNPQEKGWEDDGIQYRIFKNDETGGDGKMQQIGALPSALGDFFKSLLHKEYELKRATPEHNNFTQTKAEFVATNTKTKDKKNGNHQVREAGNGIIIYEGSTQNAEQIYGVAVSHDVYKTIYRPDGTVKANKYFSAALSTSVINFTNPHAESFDELYVYINMRGGRITNLIESSHFKLAGIVGWELSGFAAFDDYGDGNTYSSADGNLEGFFQVVNEYNNGAHHAKVILKADTTVGLRDQNLMTDFSKLPSNINPLLVNTVGVSTEYEYRPNSKLGGYAYSDAAISSIGNRVVVSAGLLLNNNFNMGLRYQGGMGDMRIGRNNLKAVNLYQNFGNADGLYFDIAGRSKFNANSKFSYFGSVGVSTTTPQVMPIVQGGISLSLAGKRGKSRTPSSR